MSRLQNIIIYEHIASLIISLPIIIYQDFFLNSLGGFFITIIIILIVFMPFKIAKGDFKYQHDPDFLENIFNKILWVRYFLIIYFVFLIFAFSLLMMSTGKKSLYWLLLIVPMFLPFYIEVFKDYLSQAEIHEYR